MNKKTIKTIKNGTVLGINTRKSAVIRIIKDRPTKNSETRW